MATTSERLREIMSIRNMKQVEIIERTGISKGALSSYISGHYVPKQDNIYKLAKALDCNPAWLMGLDVPMEEPTIKRERIESDISDAEATKAVEVFKAYMSAPPEVKATIELLLKATQSAQSANEIPHLKAGVPKSKPELPHLKKDKDK